MTEDRLKLLSSHDYIAENMENIINAFVSFYGEERREEITQKLKNVLILTFTNFEKLEDNINKVKKGIIKDIYNISEKEYLNINTDYLVEILQTGRDLHLSNEVKVKLFGEIISNEEISKNYKLGLYPKLNEFVKQYNQLKPILEPFEKQVEQYKKMKHQMEIKYYGMLVKEFQDIFTEEEIKEYNIIKYPTKRMIDYFGYTFNNNGNCFDNKSESLLKNKNSPSYKIDSILSDRITLLKNNGFIAKDENGNPILNPTYEDFLKDEKCREFIEKSRVLCERITQKKKELYEQLSQEVVEIQEDYQRCREIVDAKNYVNKNDPLGPFVFNAPISCFHENYTVTENGLVYAPLILINLGTNGLDCTIIHELNHALEAHPIEVNEERLISIDGWDIDENQFYDTQQYEEYTGISRNYELMNEYINDRLSQEITEIMHNNGNYIYSKDIGQTALGYMSVKILLEEFYQKYKDIIIKSRSNGNINYIFEMIGKDNFESLNNLVNEFYNTFGFGFDALQAVYEYVKNQDTEKAKIVRQLVSKKDEILNRIKDHYESQIATL